MQKILLKNENKKVLMLLFIVAGANFALAFLVDLFTTVMESVCQDMVDGSAGLPLELTLLFKVYWWPWLLFAASCLVIITAFRGKTEKTLILSAFMILLIDILGLAITLFITSAFFARPMWTLM